VENTQEEIPVKINIDRAKAVTTGYMSEPELEFLATLAQRYKNILEVGAWTGRSTLALADNTLGKVTAVDTWEGSSNGDLKDVLERNGKNWAWKEFQKNTEHVKNISRLWMESTKAAKINRALHNKFDMVFIDASHDYESVKADIMAWLPTVIEGGLICGHDYTTERDHCAGVIKAVDEIFPVHHIMEPNDGEHSIWWKEVRWKKNAS
jgi:predicted O-methyltransferase YrrM